MGEPQLALREGWCSVPGSHEQTPGDGEARRGCPDSSIAEGTVLITGGTGMLGGLVARHWSQSMASVICCWPAAGGQTPRAPGSFRAELESLGAKCQDRGL